MRSSTCGNRTISRALISAADTPEGLYPSPALWILSALPSSILRMKTFPFFVNPRIFLFSMKSSSLTWRGKSFSLRYSAYRGGVKAFFIAAVRASCTCEGKRVLRHEREMKRIRILVCMGSCIYWCTERYTKTVRISIRRQFDADDHSMTTTKKREQNDHNEIIP